MELALHSLDREKLTRLGEILFDVSAGRRRLDRRDLLSRVRELMFCMRDDCSHRGAASVLDRIIAVADHRLGAEGIAEAAAAEIIIGRGKPASGLPGAAK
jgi:hypothetical protein